MLGGGARVGGYFYDTDGSGKGWIGDHNTGVIGHGSYQGGYFEDTDETSHARLGYFDYGIHADRGDSIRRAVQEYIRVGVKGGAFADASQFELQEVNPDRLEITVHNCIYLKSCEALLKEGIRLKDLTCARIGAFRAAALHLADIDCTYEVTAFAIEETCRGSIERK